MDGWTDNIEYNIFGYGCHGGIKREEQRETDQWGRRGGTPEDLAFKCKLIRASAWSGASVRVCHCINGEGVCMQLSLNSIQVCTLFADCGFFKTTCEEMFVCRLSSHSILWIVAQHCGPRYVSFCLHIWTKVSLYLYLMWFVCVPAVCVCVAARKTLFG